MPWVNRQRAVKAIESLYAKLFARICSPEARTEGAAHLICYMFWDLFPLSPTALPRPDQERVEPTVPMDILCLKVMERCLTIPHSACRRGALHGLGHWQACYPQRVTDIIDRFLENTSDLPSDLQAYAESARVGEVQ
ncbi:MAG: hypothetical protein ACKVPX_16090 [Myxococcaceae bacterium]